MNPAPIAGVGLGLRAPHVEAILGGAHDIGWFEALSDNYLWGAAAPLHQLDRVSARWPVVLHGVGLSIGSVDPLDTDYVRRLGALADRCGARWISDHLSFSHADGRNSHELLPLPHTKEALRHCAARIAEVQDSLGRRILIENASSYLRCADDEMSEWDFLSGVAEAADCDILLDINNIAVNAHNHGFAAADYLAAIPPGRVRQMHLGGYEQAEDHRLDTHGAPVTEDVWALYAEALQRFGPVPCCIERDADIPAFATLCGEAARARAMMNAAG